MDKSFYKHFEKVSKQKGWINKRITKAMEGYTMVEIIEKSGLNKEIIYKFRKDCHSVQLGHFLILCSVLRVKPSSIIPDEPKFSVDEVV